MKRRIKLLIPLLLIIVLVLGTAVTVTALSIPDLVIPELKLDITDKFADPIFRSEIRKLLGKKLLEPIYSNEVGDITTLEMSKKDISSLAGIEYLSNLQVLYCGDNNLNSIDVSNNTKLNTLWCYDNNLTSLDVRNNIELKSLHCGNNKLSSLDVSKNPKLDMLWCNENNLTDLDVSKNSDLRELNCTANKLTSLDVSKHPKLYKLSCGRNLLTSLDTSNNPNLNTLYCYNNRLTSLDLSKNTKIKELICRNNYMPSESAIIGLNKAQLTSFSFDSQEAVPSAPQKLNATPGDGNVELKWSTPVYNGTSAIIGFEVSANDGSTWAKTGVVSGFTFTGLKNGQSYSFKVRAVNSNGGGLEASVKATPTTPDSPPISQYGEASSWAIPELDKAVAAELIPAILSGKDMRKSISREEFAELAVQLYEKSTGKIILVTKANPFADTTNPNILKAYQMGITAGTSANKFSPNVLITREQCATMFYRAIGVIDPSADYSIKGIPDFPDQKHISDWAVEGTKYMSKMGIILGNNSGEFMPKPLTAAHQASGYGMASREAAVLMTVRTFEKM